MMWTVLSHRLSWPSGTSVSAADLEGCNIGALVQGGHLALAQDDSKIRPVATVIVNESAEEPEEQE
jgi:hypothetical protein